MPYEERRAVASDLKRIYTAVDQDTAADELTVAEKWDQRFPTISRAWREHWEHVTPFPAFPPDLRRIVYTTNTIEALNRQIQDPQDHQPPRALPNRRRKDLLRAACGSGA